MVCRDTPASAAASLAVRCSSSLMLSTAISALHRSHNIFGLVGARTVRWLPHRASYDSRLCRIEAHDADGIRFVRRAVAVELNHAIIPTEELNFNRVELDAGLAVWAFSNEVRAVCLRFENLVYTRGFV